MDATSSRSCTASLKYRKPVNGSKAAVMFFHVAIMTHVLQEVLKVELNRLSQFFQEVKFCRLPLNPALVVLGIEEDVSIAHAMDFFLFFFLKYKEGEGVYSCVD